MDQTTTRMPGASAAPDVRGIDRPDQRPGVPMEGDAGRGRSAPPTGPQRQTSGRAEHLHRAGLDDLTPVFGTSVPPRGVSGMMRKAAYDIPEHYARHWMLLMAADRVDVLEGRLGDALAGPMESVGFETGAHYARKNPLAVLAGTVVGAWVAKKIIF